MFAPSLDRRFHDKLIIIGSPSKNHTVDNGTEKIYYRHQCGSRLIELTENVLKKTSIDPDASLSLKYDPFSLMTSRQKEVLNYVSAGMNPNEIADKMQINEKTVSGHKRAAMNKLQLKKTTELYHWLCINNVINS